MLDSLAAFFGMGGYAFFVWGSYGVVAAVLIQQFAAPVIRRRRLLRELAEADDSAHFRHPRTPFRHPRSVLSGGGQRESTGTVTATDRARARLKDCGRDGGEDSAAPKP